MNLYSTNDVVTNLKIAHALLLRNAVAYNAKVQSISNGFIRGQILARSLKAQRSILREARDYMLYVKMYKNDGDNLSAAYFLYLAQIALRAFKAERACYNMARAIKTKSGR